jgi:hypothetical protein|tara:strand:- start:3969 stop:4457 length:489 start_codon:yes stop_codon:yes gene_type:complete
MTKIETITEKAIRPPIIEKNPPHNGINAPKNKFEDLLNRPTLIVRTATAVDLSGGAETLVVFHTERAAEITRVYVLYTEETSADAGITIKIGKMNSTTDDDDYYFTGTSLVSQTLWDSTKLTLLKRDISTGDTVVFASAGGKTGTGEIMLIMEYIFVEEYKR